MTDNRYFLAGLMATILLAAAVRASASECGVLRLQTARSAGVQVVNNACNDSESLALDSVVQLGSDSRAWFESISDTPGAGRFQIICQNLSPSPVKLKLANSSLPWFQSAGLLDCAAWTNDRLECKQPEGDELGLICAIAVKKIVVATHEIQRNTSVIMRSKEKSANSRILDDRDVKQLGSVIDKEINPKLKLCESLFTRDVTIAWTIKMGGRVANTAITGDADDDEFALCALKAVESCVFPAYANDIQVQSTFK